MRIIHFHTSMAGGGIEAMICNLANQMADFGHNVSVGTIFNHKDSDVFWGKLSTSVNKIELGKVKTGFSFKEIISIYKCIKQGNYEVVHIHGFFYYYFFTILMLHKKVRFFYTIHSDAFKENTKWDQRILSIKKIFFKYKWMIPVTISQESKSSFYKCYGLDSTLIYNGTSRPHIQDKLDLTQYKISSQTKLLFHPGRITEAKNQVMLCKVCQRLINEGYDIVLLIAGTMQDQEIMSRIQSFLSNRIIYLGERSDVLALMKSVDAFCLSSIWEGLPVTLLEALSVGCIPVCTPVGGIPEIVKNNINGFLSASVDINDYYKTLKRFLDLGIEDTLIIKSKAMDSFEAFDIKNITKKYLNLYASKL